MHSFIALSLLLALTASVSAIPYGAHQAHQLLHARKNFLKYDVTPLAGRQESLPTAPFGQCGGDSGFGCADGYCCSQWGYCGTSQDYCGKGCQFGACSGESIIPASNEGASIGTAQANSSTISIAMVTKAFDNGPQAGYTNSPAQTFDTSDKVAATSAPSEPTFFSATSPVQHTTFATQYAPASSAAAPAPASTSYAPPPSYSAPSSGSAGGSGFGNTYKMYTGDGSTGAGWPTEADWMSYDEAWESNMKDISISCAQFHVDNNSDEESQNLKSAISNVAQESGIDERFILAVVMQESKGCVRAPTTQYSVRNPGLMQSHNGRGTCNDASNGGVQNPCPMEQITQQIKDGVMGTADVSGGGDGLEQTIQQAGTSDVSKYYRGARIYNSGRVTDNDLGAGVATHCYAADVANRLTGWVSSQSLCTLDG